MKSFPLAELNITCIFSGDAVCKEVSVAVNDEESRIVFIDHRHGEMSVRKCRIPTYLKWSLLYCLQLLKVENQLFTYSPDAILVLMAVDDKSTKDQAEMTLGYLRMTGVMEASPVILVANKTDLVRSRVVKMSGES